MNNRAQTVEAFVENVLRALTLEEKVSLCHSGSKFGVNPVERLGIPVLEMSDGPHGVRHEISKTSWEPAGCDDDHSTYLPTGTAQAATWNRELMAQAGTVLGSEARHRGKDVILGPGLNIIRTPLCGRNFEYYSEDPYLVRELVVPAIRAIQEQDVAACAKHYAANNQELNRTGTDVEVDERTLREIYLPGFEAAVREGGVLTVMGAYNKFRGQHCCHHAYLVNEVLKSEWGFQGAFISDWAGVTSTEEAVRCGTDIEMGTNVASFDDFFLARAYLEGLRSGLYSMADLDDKVRRTLRVMYLVGMFDADRKAGARNTPEHQKVALDCAREAIVLLKNEGNLLPLDRSKIRRLAVIGENAAIRHAAGGNSSGVKTLYEVTPLEGIRRLLGDSVEVVYARGYPDNRDGLEPIPTPHLFAADAGSGVRGWKTLYQHGRSFAGKGVEGYAENAAYNDLADTLPPGFHPQNFCITWHTELTAPETGSYAFGFVTDGIAELLVNGESVCRTESDATRHLQKYELQLTEGEVVSITLRHSKSDNATYVKFGWTRPGQARTESVRDEALALARSADAVIFVGGLTHMDDIEGRDRKDLTLPDGQDELISDLLQINADTILSFIGGSPVAMPWIAQAKAVLWLWYAGMEGGTAAAEVLFGITNPSGKLPFTFPRQLADVPAHNNLGTYQADISHYREGLMVGYRYHVTHEVTPLFCFGHGLSYTRFSYTDLSVASDPQTGSARVEVSVTNTGALGGKDVVQLYIEDVASSVPRPKIELKGFAKVHLEPGESTRVAFSINRKDLSFYDEASRSWIAEDGEFVAHVGSSSENLPLQKRFSRASR